LTPNQQEKGSDFRGDTDLLIYLLGGDITEHTEQRETTVDTSSDDSNASGEQKYLFALYCPLQLARDGSFGECTPRETEQIATTYLFEVEDEFDYFNWMVKLKKITTLLESKQMGNSELVEEDSYDNNNNNNNGSVESKGEIKATKDAPPLTRRKMEEKIEKEGMLLFKKETKKALQKIKQRTKKWKRCLVLLQDFYLTVYNVDKVSR